MAVRPPAQAPRTASPFRFIFLLGLLFLAIGFVLLMLSFQQRDLRVAGAVCLLSGVVLTGGYLTSRLFSGMYADPLAYEPPWAKLGRGEGPPRLPAPGKQAVLPSKPVAFEKLVDFPEAAPRRPPAPASKAATSPMPARKAAPSPAPASKVAASHVSVTTWTAELFDLMSPQQFEAVCAALFAQGGFTTRCEPQGPTGGVTIWLYSRNAQQGTKPAAVAQCTQWRGREVGVREMHPLLELMETHGLQRGTYATSSTYTVSGRNFAKFNRISALDGPAILGLIAQRTPEQQQALLLIALDGP
jgi:hypothetical protein